MVRSKAWSELLSIADQQWGLITKRQAETLGIAWSTIARQADSDRTLERVAHGIYRVAGSGTVDHVDLRAAWLQLAPDTFAWERPPESGVVSHRSAADLYGLGHLPADTHEFTVTGRKQSRRSDVRLHHRTIDLSDRETRQGLPVTLPHQTVADLLTDREDPEAIAHAAADALRHEITRPELIIGAIAPHAVPLGLASGADLLAWLLELVDDQDSGDRGRALHDGEA